MALTSGLVQYVQAVKNATKEKESLMLEATMLFTHLHLIRSKMNNYIGDKCPEGMESLDEKDGPLKQYEYLIRKLHDGLENKNWSKFVWSLKKRGDGTTHSEDGEAEVSYSGNYLFEPFQSLANDAG
jgi:hypothetical protein